MMLPYSGDSFITFLGIFLLAIPIFFALNKNVLKTIQERLWNETCQTRAHLSLTREARDLTNHKYPGVDPQWQEAKTRLRGALNRCQSGYNAHFAFVFLSVLSSFIFILCLSMVFLAFYHHTTHSVKAADAMLIIGETVFVVTIMAEAYCYAIRNEIESPMAIVLYSFLAAILAVLISLVWTKWVNYPTIISPSIARNIYFLYIFLPIVPFGFSFIHTGYIYFSLLCRFTKLRRAIKEFKSIESLLR